MYPELSFEANRTLIDKFSWSVLRRTYAAGAPSVQIDDIRQELAMAWVKAVELWKPEYNVPFGPYLMTGMKCHINRWCQHEIGESRFAAFSLDMEIDEDGSPTLHTMTACNQKSPEDAIIEKDLYDKIVANLSPRAGRFVSLLISPPEEVVEVSNAIAAKAQFGRTMGFQSFAPVSVTASLIFDLMRMTAIERREIRDEIEDRSKGWNTYD